LDVNKLATRLADSQKIRG